MVEELPTRPYHDEKRRIKDMRIAHETGEVEQTLRDMIREKPNDASLRQIDSIADTVSEATYRKIGMPVDAGAVPDAVLSACKQLVERRYRQHGLFGARKFNKIELPDGDEYLIRQPMPDHDIMLRAKIVGGGAVARFEEDGDPSVVDS